MTNSSLITTVKHSSSESVIAKTNPSLNSLGPGTLILANGNILPILPQTQILPTQTIIPPPIIVNPTPTNNTTLFVVSNKVISPSTNKSNVTKTSLQPATNTMTMKVANILSKNFSNIKPKIGVTKTTQINKVPIPALTSQYTLNSASSKKEKICSKKKTADKKTIDKHKNPTTIEAEQKQNDDEIKTKNKRRISTEKVAKKRQKISSTAEESKKETNSANNQVDPNKKTVASSYTIDSLCKANKEGKTEEKMEERNVSVIKESENVDTARNDDISKESEINAKKDEVKIQEKPVIDVVPILPEIPPEKEKVIESSLKIKTLENNISNKENAEISDEKPSTCSKPNINKEKSLLPELPGKSLEISELSNDIFASLQVPTGSQNPESTSPTAAFLLAFPLVSTLTGVKVTEVIEEETSDSHNGTPTLLQIGTMDTTKPTQTQPENITASLLNLDNFSFFSSKDMCNNFFQPFDNISTTTSAPVIMTSAVQPTTVSSSCNTTKITSTAPKTSTLENKKEKTLFETSYIPPITKESQSWVKNNSVANKNNEKLNNTEVFQSLPSSTVTVSVNNTYNTIYTQPYQQPTNTVVATSCKSYHPPQSSRMKSVNEQMSCRQYRCLPNKSNGIEDYNAFNSFTEIPKTNTCSYTDTSKIYNETLNTNYSYNYQNENNFDSTYSSTKVSSRNDRPYYQVSYDPSYADYKNTEVNHLDSNFYNQITIQDKNKFVNTKSKSHTQPRPPVNWMTTPDIKQQSTDFLLPPIAKEVDFVPPSSIYSTAPFISTSQSTYFNTNAPIYSSTNIQNSYTPANTFTRNEVEENHFSWSPTKIPQMLDPPSFVSATLPTLVGDLALGNNQLPFMEHKSDLPKQPHKTKENTRRNKQQNYDNQSNFLSVSQLVDHNKTPLPGRVSSRRNSGNRSKTTNQTKRSQKQKLDIKDPHLINQNYSAKTLKNQTFPQENAPINWMPNNKQNRQSKNASSSYSAEALIGHQSQTDAVMTKSRNNQQNNSNFPLTSKALNVPTFLTDNIMPYFTSVDLPTQDNNFSQQTGNYQTNAFTHNFSTNNTYSTSSFMQTKITSSYLPNAHNLIPEITPHEYNPVIASENNIFSHSNNKHYKNASNKQNSSNRIDDRRHANNTSNNCSNNVNMFNKKIKKKQSNEANLPGLVDFSFLSMPSAINSPILPDDFHAHSNFLPPPPTPTQLYPCKNPLYPKQTTDLLPLPSVNRNNMQPEISPPMNNVGTSLTNFNLSTIFPEMNKVSGSYKTDWCLH